MLYLLNDAFTFVEERFRLGTCRTEPFAGPVITGALGWYWLFVPVGFTIHDSSYYSVTLPEVRLSDASGGRSSAC